MFAARLLSNLSSVATLVVYLASGEGLKPWKIVGTLAVVALAIGVTIVDAYRSWKARARRFAPSSPRIKEYLKAWIASGGRTAIVSRNLSWVDDEDSKSSTGESKVT
jgi:cytochrome b